MPGVALAVERRAAYRQSRDASWPFTGSVIQVSEPIDGIQPGGLHHEAAGGGIEGGKQNMGKLMGPVMAKDKGRADGNAVRKVVMDFLG